MKIGGFYLLFFVIILTNDNKKAVENLSTALYSFKNLLSNNIHS